MYGSEFFFDSVCLYMYIMNFLISWGNLRGIRIYMYFFYILNMRRRKIVANVE